MDGRKDFTFNTDKNGLRRMLKERRKNIADKHTLDRIITERVKNIVSGNVMVYASIGSEISTTELIKELMRAKDIVLYAPYTSDDKITPRRLVVFDGEKPNGRGNLPENCYALDEKDGAAQTLPIKLDYCITPLLGFNGDGFRIGYGKGCYDRFFAVADTVKIGLAYENMRVQFTPDFNDVPLDCCVTEQNVIYF